MASGIPGRPRPTLLRIAADIALAPVDLAMDFVVRPVLGGRGAQYPSAASPTGRKSSWRPFGMEPFWYGRNMAADAERRTIEAHYDGLRSKALEGVPLWNVMERIGRVRELNKRRDARIEELRERQAETRRARRSGASARVAGTPRGKAPASPGNGWVALQRYAGSAPEQREKMARAFPPHVRAWVESLPKSALWELSQVSPEAVRRTALGQPGGLRHIAAMPQPAVAATLGGADLLRTPSTASREATLGTAKAAVGRGRRRPDAVPDDVHPDAGIMAGVTAEKVESFLNTPPERVDAFLERSGSASEPDAEELLSGMTAQQVQILREMDRDGMKGFVDDVRSGRASGDLKDLMHPKALANLIDMANARARASAPRVPGDEGILDRVTPEQVRAFRSLTKEQVEGFARLPTATEARLAGFSVEQARVLRAFAPELLDRFVGDAGKPFAKDLGSYLRPEVMAFAVERGRRNAGPLPTATPAAAQARAAGGDAEVARVHATIDAIGAKEKEGLSLLNIAGRRQVDQGTRMRRDAATAQIAASRLEWPGLPAGLRLEDVRGKPHRYPTDINFDHGAPLGDAVKRYAGASAEGRAGFRGMPPTIKAWLDGMGADNLARLAKADELSCQLTALGVRAGIAGVPVCPMPPERAAIPAAAPSGTDAPAPPRIRLGDRLREAKGLPDPEVQRAQTVTYTM